MRRLCCGLLFGLGACTSSGSEAPPEPVAVTIQMLQHDNPAYRKADQVAFDAYVAQHPKVTITTTSIDYASLTSKLLADLPATVSTPAALYACRGSPTTL